MIECNPYMPDFPISNPIAIRVGQAQHTVTYGPYFSNMHDGDSSFPYKASEGNLMHQKNYVVHLTTNSRVMNPRENPYFPEYHGERGDYFHHHRNTAQQLSSPLLQKLMEAMCKGRQDNAGEPEQYQEFMECLNRLLVCQLSTYNAGLQATSQVARKFFRKPCHMSHDHHALLWFRRISCHICKMAKLLIHNVQQLCCMVPTFSFLPCVTVVAGIDRENPYLARNIEYRKQMKNLQWLLGNPFEVFVSLDTGYTHFNEKKNDIVDDALLRDIFYGSVHIAVAFDVLKRFEEGLTSIVARFDAQDAARAAAAAAERTRVQPARQVPAPRPTSPTPRSPKATRKVASPSKAAERGTKQGSSAVANMPTSRQKRTPVAGSPSASSANPLNRLAEVAGQKADNPTPSASVRGDQESSGGSAFRPEAPVGAPAIGGSVHLPSSQTSQRSPPKPEATPEGQSTCTASVAGLLY